MATLFVSDFSQIEDANGVPQSGATRGFFRSGTTTEITTYQDAAATTPHTNPVVADASGVLPAIYISYGAAIKVIDKTAAGVTLRTVDPVYASTGGELSADGVSFTPAGNIAATDVQAAIEELDGEKLALTGGTLTGGVTATAFVPSGSTVPTNGMYLLSANNLAWSINSVSELRLSAAGLFPATTGGLSLGLSSARWDGLHLQAASAINWSNGDVTATHATNALAFAGASSGYSFDANVTLNTSGASATLSLTRTDIHGDGVFVAGIGYNGKDHLGNSTQYASMSVVALQDNDGSEAGEYRFNVIAAGANGDRLRIRAGLFHGSATGGDKGDNTINFGAVYDDNTLLTCMAMAKEFIESGEVDLAKWDALVPDQIVPESVESVPVTIEVEVEREVVERDKDGDLVQKMVTATETRQVVTLDPVWDEDGNGLDMVETPVTEEVVTPEQVIIREHRTARVFKAMLDSGFDPRDPEQYFARMSKDEALPGMPTQADWIHSELSIGEMHSRQWLATEMLAIVCNVMWAKLNDHEARLSAAGL